MHLGRVFNVRMTFAYIIDGIMNDNVMFSESWMIELYFSRYALRIRHIIKQLWNIEMISFS